MTELNRELQSLSPSAFVELFELNLARVGGQIFRFCSNTNLLSSDIVWQGQTYVRLPIEVDGFDRTSNGALPRPVMRVSNLQGAMAALARENKYFLGCKLTRKRTFARFLDTINFPPIVLSPPRFLGRASIATYVKQGMVHTAGANEVRYEYDESGNPTTLLLEGEAINRVRGSHGFAQLSWRKTNTVASPSTLFAPCTPAANAIFVKETVSPTGPFLVGQTFTDLRELEWCTWSIHVRAANSASAMRRYVSMVLAEGDSGGVTRAEVSVDVLTGEVSGPSSQNTTVTLLADGWYRVALKLLLPSGTGGIINGAVYLAKSPNEINYVGEPDRGVYLYGAQMEQGQIATSYILTLGLNDTTRAADNYIASLPGNPEADPTQHLPDEVWFVDRKANENKLQIDFELASAMDMQGVMLPKRQIIQNCCAWTYRSAECSYTGGPVAKEDGTPTSSPAEDKCGLRLSDCKKRFTEGALPYGGFPGCGLVK